MSTFERPENYTLIIREEESKGVLNSCLPKRVKPFWYLGTIYRGTAL